MVTAPDVPAGRLASLVHIMRGRWSVFSRLGILELDAGVLTLPDAAGASLFSVPVTGIRAAPQRRVSVHQVFFRIRAADRWWYLAAHVPTRYQRKATRELAARYQVRELVPRMPGLDAAAYARLTATPTSHQVMWAACWLAVLRRAGRPPG
jgi:hypothetical protein